jgi:hypothetical protein
MKLRNLAAASVAAGALALGASAFAQEENKPQPAAKPEASQPQRDEHRAGHRSERGRHGMGRMHETRGGCHGESQGKGAGEHRHS